MLKVDKLAFEYGGKTILSDVSFELSPNCVAVLLGPNGSGKTTLLRCLDQFLKPKRGVATLDGTPLNSLSQNELARRVAYMPQRCVANGLTVFDSLLLGRKPFATWRPRPRDFELVEETLVEFNLQDKATRTLDRLSGGELQKVALGRIFVQEPKLLLLDEPTSALDLKNRFEILRLLKNYACRKRATVLTSVHSLDDAFRIADRLLLLKNGKLFADATPETMSEAALSELYDFPLQIVACDCFRTIIPKGT